MPAPANELQLLLGLHKKFEKIKKETTSKKHKV